MNKRFKPKEARWNLRVFGGTSHPEMSVLVAKKAGVKLGDVTLNKFANNETNVVVNEVVRGQNVYIIQTAGAGKPHDHLMEVLFMVNACRLSAAATITVVMPLFFYSQADNKDNYRVSITGKLVANMLKKAGVSKVMILDPRTPQLEGFFDAPIDAIKVEPVVSHWIKENVENYKDCVVMCPDETGIRKVIVIADDLDIDHATVNTRLRRRADISDGARKQLRHSVLNHQHMSENWHIVTASSDDDEQGEDEVQQQANDIERTLRFSESNTAAAASATCTTTSSSSSSSLDDGLQSSSCNGDADDDEEVENDGRSTTGGHHKVLVSRKTRKSLTPGEPKTSKAITAFANACSENEEHQFLETKISGEVKGKVCVLIDDVIDTGRGMKAAVEALVREGAAGVHVWATHGVFAPEALAIVQNLDRSFVRSVTVTNSIPQEVSKQILGDRLQVIDVSGLIAEAIRRHHYCESVAMISYCLNSQPLIKNPTGDVVLAAAEGPSSAASQMKVVEKNPVRNPGIERLRKGFRLSSKCWD